MTKLDGNVGAGHRVYVHSTLEAEFALLDSLPSPIRRAIQDAPYDFSVRDVVEAWNRSRTEFDWDTMSYNRLDPVSFARNFVANVMIETKKLSMTGVEEGRYWFKKRSGSGLTHTRRRAILRRAASKYALPTPRSICK